MQFNRSINSCFQNHQFSPYFPQPLLSKDVIGEGEIVPLMFPDGTTQLYFIPTYVHNKGFYPYHSFNGQFHYPAGTEAWFIRKISSPAISNLIQENIPQGDPFLRSYYASKGNVDLIPQQPFCQKFHSDNVTSTTDMHYFFPRKKNLNHSISVQVDPPASYNVSAETEHVGESCFCHKKNKSKAKDSSSAMSFDDETQTGYKRKKNSKVKFTTPKVKRGKACTCQQGCKESRKRDQKISTYTDRSMNCDCETNRTSQTSRQECRHSVNSKLSETISQMSCDSCCGTCFYCVSDCTSGCNE